MGIGDASPSENQSAHKEQRDETTPLLPVKAEEEDGIHEFNGASFSGAVFNLSTTIVGAGIMALPASIKMLGIIPGILMIILVALLTEASIDMMVRCSHQAKITSYGWLMGDSFGQWGRIALQASVVINNVGDVLSGTSTTGVHHRGIFEGWFGPHFWNSRPVVLLATTIFVFAPLVSFKRLDSLRYTSALSVALAVVFVVITAGIAILRLIEGTAEIPKLFPEIHELNSIWELFTAVPVLVTAYICHYNVHSIDNELEDRSQTKPIVRTSLALCSSVYVATSFFAYLLFGEGTLSDVLANFDSDLHIPFSSVFNDIVRFTGATAAVLIGFIFPAMIILRDSYGIATKRDKVLAVTMIVLAVLSNSVALYSDAMSIFYRKVEA
ncbi:unnamed protein product [Triticum turgidum subsp. durum]|uniref:Amino acid transporter transmembrane domain-containing protein n=1 Tax=Triticum turgidum subsp. durum TaxID=4567 RepID=A0A9R0XY32_TRITD|nr:unnamed protein product [Triticum turgidum subsp. durum]